MITIRQAQISDRDALLKFIKEYWSENHVFVRKPELFDFQHLDYEKIQYLLALDNEMIVGVLGFIVYGDVYADSDAFIALWKVREDYQGKIGIDLMDSFSKMGFKSCSCIGIAEKVLPIYQFMGYTVGKMYHHYILNTQLEDRCISSVLKRDIQYVNKAPEKHIQYITDIESVYLVLDETKEHFYKSSRFFKKRYVEHPYYTYMFLGIYESEKLIAVLVCREQYVKDSKILRIVDIVGDRAAIYDVVYQLKKYLDETQYEYIDLYQYGLDTEKLDAGGFVLKDDEQDIIPNYFEPFAQKNVDIYWATRLKGNYVFFKADGDQDRPNLLGR